MLRLSSSLLLVLAAAAAFAQGSDDTVFRTDTRLVVLHASVVDKHGKLITNLPQQAFKVFENGAEQSIKVFRREDVPISLGIIIDNSGSMRPRRSRVERASLDLVRASNPQDEVFVVNFNDEAYLDVPFTSDIKKMEEGIARIDSRGGTALRDSISMSMDYLKKEGKKDKKVLLVVTDGADTASNDRDTLEKLVDKAHSDEILIYAIGLLNEEVAHEIRNQYIIAYTPTTPPDGSFRQIKVTVNGPGHPTVRTRTGYYATPETRTASLEKP